MIALFSAAKQQAALNGALRREHSFTQAYIAELTVRAAAE
jgi:hypothetical protein